MDEFFSVPKSQFQLFIERWQKPVLKVIAGLVFMVSVYVVMQRHQDELEAAPSVPDQLSVQPALNKAETKAFQQEALDEVIKKIEDGTHNPDQG